MGQVVADKNCEKIHKLSEAMYCCGAGTAVGRREGGRERGRERGREGGICEKKRVDENKERRKA
jgi:hypothetical protein